MCKSVKWPDSLVVKSQEEGNGNRFHLRQIESDSELIGMIENFLYIFKPGDDGEAVRNKNGLRLSQKGEEHLGVFLGMFLKQPDGLFSDFLNVTC
ncbi:MAG TPA: hypothetical protein DEV72_19715 [Ktedonobacter sp.]|nr:hypothetical protein [Ktedonobacter sp.]